MQNLIDHLPLNPRIKRALPYILIIFIVFVVIGGVWLTNSTQNIPQDEKIGQDAISDITGSLVGAFFKLLLVFALIFLSFSLLKWWQTKRPGQPKRRLTVIETINLTPRRALHLIKVGPKEFIIGSTDHAMNLISEIQPEEELNPECEETKAPQNFEQVLTQTLISPIKNIQQKHESRSN